MRYKIIIIIAIIFSGCIRGEENSVLESDAKFKIDLSEVETVPIEQLLEIEKGITLTDLPPPGIFQNIDKFIPVEEGFMLLDKKMSNLYLFNDSGSFVRKIGNRGGGPEEYKKINDIAFDHVKSEVHILSNEEQSVIIYSIGGKFIERIRLDFFTNSFFYENGNYYFDHGYDTEDHFNLIKANNKGDRLKSYFPYPENRPVMVLAFSGGLNNKGNSWTYTDATSSVIYQKIEKEISPKYSIKIDNETWEYKNRHDLNRFTREMRQFNVSFLQNTYISAPEALIFEYQQNQSIKRAYYKHDDKVFQAESKLDQLLSIPIGLVNDSTFVAFVNPDTYKLLKNYYPNVSERLRDYSPILYQKLELEDNNDYFLVFYTLK